MTDPSTFSENFPLKYIEVPDDWYDRYDPERAPNVMVMEIANGEAEGYFFIDAEFLDEALEDITESHNRFDTSDNPFDIDDWSIYQYGSSIKLVGDKTEYVLLPHHEEIFRAAFWVGLYRTFDSHGARVRELDRIRDTIWVEGLELHEAVEQTDFRRSTLHKADLVAWFNEGIIGRDYHDKYQDGLSFSAEQAEKHEADSAPMTVGAYHQNEIYDTHLFYEIGFTEVDISYSLDLPLSIVKDYIEGIPPLLGAGIMKAISDAGHDPFGMQLRYIEYADQI